MNIFLKFIHEYNLFYIHENVKLLYLMKCLKVMKRDLRNSLPLDLFLIKRAGQTC
ncbi:hypothetical protein SD77_1651 [Bacillus badius]|uniref:Mobile element protein n=1 Tax=Bacillus badius TaxID=1455 RepID=A0ABR5AR99_BACBA|nr:hypothetical protein SD77_1651 [Bacillus badius]